MWIVTLFALLNLKHFLCDYVFQTPTMLRDKAHYGRPGGIAHAGLHGVGTLVAVLIALPWTVELIIWALVLAVFDAVVHYHTDWLKARGAAGVDSSERQFWIYHGADQSIHYLTYCVIAATLLYI